MKKFFALVLAVAMVMSLAAVSFAAEGKVVLSKAGDYDADYNTWTEEPKSLEYGDTVYFKLGDELGDEIYDYARVEKMKVKATYEMGADLVESVSIVKKKVGSEYIYFVAVKVADKQVTYDSDIIGTFEFNRKADKDENIAKIKDVEVDFEINVFYDKWWLDSAGGAKTDYNVEGDDVELKWDTEYALKFNYDDEVDFTFGYEDMNEGTFTVDVSGQGKLYVEYNTKAVDAIVDANPGVDMHFINFNGAKFNRTGEFMYEMEDGVAAYKVVDGALVAIPGLEYDEADEAFYFNTRVLESYVFANAELVNPVVDAPAVEVAPAPEVTNPSTGA